VGLRDRTDEPVGRLSSFDRLRFLIARGLARGPRHLVVRDPDAAVAPGDVGRLLALLRLIARSDHLGIVVSLAHGAPARNLVDGVLVLHEGLLRFHGHAESLEDQRDPWRAGALSR
jgi:ABC-type histidine transport system ATPase subunit